MTPADVERAVEALRRAFPAVSDEGVERFRRELEPAPKWYSTGGPWFLVGDGHRELAVCEALELSDRWVYGLWDAQTGDYAATRSEAMRAAERALGLPECEVVP